MALKHELKTALAAAVAACRVENSLPALGTAADDSTLPLEIEAARSPADGDYSTNIALTLARAAGRGGEADSFAETLAAKLNAATDSGPIASAESAGGGFLNLRLKPDALGGAVRQILADGDRYGRTSGGTPRQVLVEFVSANPNGPITVAHGRGGAIGDTLASLNEWIGNTVSREFYVNDTIGSRQMQIFAQSLFARYRQLLGQEAEIPEDGYSGEYLIEVAQRIVDTEGERHLTLTPEAATLLFQTLAFKGTREQQTATLAAFGIHYDTWFSEQTLHASGAVETILHTLKERGLAFEENGALWLRSTQFGDDNDRVLVRAAGTPTYLAGDLAYHADKLARGFDLLIDVWGADHQGYIARTKAGLAALGYAPDQLQIALYQPVRLLRNGAEEKMGKHNDSIATLDELIEDVGKDAARFFFLLQPASASLDFDLDLAHKQSKENPLYSVQSAHSRCGSAVTGAAGLSVTLPGDMGETPFARLTQQEEIALIKKLVDFPDEIQQAAEAFAPDRIARYAVDLAALSHKWLDRDSRNTSLISSVESDIPLSRARLALAAGVRTTLANALTLLGVSGPERLSETEPIAGTSV